MRDSAATAPMISVREAVDSVASRPDLPQDARAYLEVAQHRFHGLIEQIAQGPSPGAILDVSPSLLTDMLRVAFPASTVNSLGFPYPNERGRREGERHVEYDLNRMMAVETWPEPVEHDVVVFAEIIEHLFASPLMIMRFLSGWLAPGGRLLVQTPNAAAVHKRLRALAGRQPAGDTANLLHIQDKNPSHFQGHFREYYVEELLVSARWAGLEVTQVQLANHLWPAGRKGRVLKAVTERLPPRLRLGITIECRRPAAA